jgi:hypothetical protein
VAVSVVVNWDFTDPELEVAGLREQIFLQEVSKGFPYIGG